MGTRMLVVVVFDPQVRLNMELFRLASANRDTFSKSGYKNMSFMKTILFSKGFDIHLFTCLYVKFLSTF